MATNGCRIDLAEVRRLRAAMDRRIVVSAISGYGLAGFALAYFAFWSPLSLGMPSALGVLAAFLAFVAVNGVAWGSWEIRYRTRLGAR